MRQNNGQAAELRQLLLGQLPEEKASLLEERIFADADFAEMMEIIEGELIAEYRAGELSLEERALFERQYLTTDAGRREVKYEEGFDEFIHATIANNRDTLRHERLAPLGEDAPPRVDGDAPTVAPEGAQPENFLTRLRSLFDTHPALIPSLAVTLLLLLTVGSLYFLTRRSTRPPGDEPLSAERRAAETDLARLNTDAAASPRAEEVTTVDLQPLQRSGGETMPRIPVGNPARSNLLKLRLSLATAVSANYRAVFLDDRRNELFAISNLPARNTPDGPQVSLLVPAKYFKRGDYQIDLSVNKDGGYEVNSYAFRITETR
jgi:hypothetical protein